MLNRFTLLITIIFLSNGVFAQKLSPDKDLVLASKMLDKAKKEEKAQQYISAGQSYKSAAVIYKNRNKPDQYQLYQKKAIDNLFSSTQPFLGREVFLEIINTNNYEENWAKRQLKNLAQKSRYKLLNNISKKIHDSPKNQTLTGYAKLFNAQHLISDKKSIEGLKILGELEKIADKKSLFYVEILEQRAIAHSQHNVSDALQTINTCIKNAEKINAPQDVKASIYGNKGKWLLALSKYQEAQIAYNRAISQLPKPSLQKIDLMEGKTKCIWNISDDKKSRLEIIEMYHQNIVFLPPTPNNQYALAEHCANVSDLYIKTHKNLLGLDALVEGITILDKFGHQSSLHKKHLKTILKHKKANLLYNKGKFVEAEHDYQYVAQNLNEQVRSKVKISDSAMDEIMKKLAEVYEKLGNIHALEQNLQEAYNNYDQSITAYQELQGVESDEAKWVKIKKVHLMLQMHNHEEAVEALKDIKKSEKDEDLNIYLLSTKAEIVGSYLKKDDIESFNEAIQFFNDFDTIMVKHIAEKTPTSHTCLTFLQYYRTQIHWLKKQVGHYDNEVFNTAIINAIERERLLEYMADTEQELRETASELFSTKNFITKSTAIAKKNKKTALWTWYLSKNELITYKVSKKDVLIEKFILSNNEKKLLIEEVKSDQTIGSLQELSKRIGINNATSKIQQLNIATNDALGSLSLQHLDIYTSKGKALPSSAIKKNTVISIFK